MIAEIYKFSELPKKVKDIFPIVYESFPEQSIGPYEEALYYVRYNNHNLAFFEFPNGTFLVHPKKTLREINDLLPYDKEKWIKYSNENFIKELFKAGDEAEEMERKSLREIEKGIDPRISLSINEAKKIFDNFEEKARTLVEYMGGN